MRLKVKVEDRIERLVRDQDRFPARTTVRMARVVKKSAERGNRAGKRIAKRSARQHGKHYPDAWSAEVVSPLVSEYGPDSALPQGGMSFNEGSRNQPPHHDLEKSLDIERPRFHRDVRKALDGLFW